MLAHDRLWELNGIRVGMGPSDWYSYKSTCGADKSIFILPNPHLFISKFEIQLSQTFRKDWRCNYASNVY